MVITEMKKMMKKILSTNVLRFLFIGGCATLIDFGFYILFSTRYTVTLAKTMSMLISSVFSYVFNKNWTFKNKDKTNWLYLLKYYFTFMINVGTNVCINYLVFEKTGYMILAFVIATTCAMTINFLLQRFFVFRKQEEM